jgi:hypothetical protein
VPFLHDSMCELYPEYIGTVEYNKSLEKINNKAYEFIKDSCETGLDIGLDIATHHNYSKIKLAYNVLNETCSTQVKQNYNEIKQGIATDLKSMELTKDPKPKTNNNIIKTDFNTKIDKTTLTKEEKEEIKSEPKKLQSKVEQKTSVLKEEFKTFSKTTPKAVQYRCKEYIKTTGELGETAYLIGMLAKDENLISAGIVAMNSAKIAQSVSDIVNTGLTIANSNNILSAIVSLSFLFGSKRDPNAYLKSVMQGIQTILQTIHHDMITNFNKVFKQLGEIKTSIIVGFRNLDIKTHLF